jgi:hypothetical protein
VVLKARRENDTVATGAVNALTFVSANSTNRDDHDSLRVGFIFNRKMFNCQRMSRGALQGGQSERSSSRYRSSHFKMITESQKMSVMTSTFPRTDWNARREPLDVLCTYRQLLTVRWYGMTDPYIRTQTVEKRLLHTYTCIIDRMISTLERKPSEPRD